MVQKASIVGVGCTKFGSVLTDPELKGLTFQEMVAEAAFEAMDDAGITPDEIDAFYVGNMLAHTSQVYSHATLLSDWLGLRFKGGFHFDTACSTTNTGIGIASNSIWSGKYKNVLVVGGEILSSVPENYNQLTRKGIDAQTLWGWTDFGVDHVYAYHHSYDVASAYGAIPTMGYMKKYGLSFEQMDETMYYVNKAVRMHASLNPKAMIRQDLDALARSKGYKDSYEFWKSKHNPFFAWPTRLLSALNTADGASAYVISGEPKKYDKKTPVEVKGFHWTTSNYPWYGTDSTTMPQDVIAFREAYKMAGIEPKDIDYLYVHDCMQIHQLEVSEIAGYFPKGQSWKAFIEGRTTYKGDKPLNTSGGRHGVGHAFEASAGSETYHIVKQMRGEAGKVQFSTKPKIAVQHNHGYGMHTAVTVLERGD